MTDKIKAPNRKTVFILYGVVFLLLVTLSVWAYVNYIRESTQQAHNPQNQRLILIDTTDRSPQHIPLTEDTSFFFASKSGTRYYPENCSKGDRVKPENRVYFESADSAERAGLSLAVGC